MKFPGDLRLIDDERVAELIKLIDPPRIRPLWPTLKGMHAVKALSEQLLKKKDKFSTLANEAVFWSNRDMNQDQMARYILAMKDAGYSKKCLEMTEGGKWLLEELIQLQKNGVYLTWSQEKILWKKASQFFVQGASGSVAAFANMASKTSEFLQAELPVLNNKSSVTEISTYVY